MSDSKDWASMEAVYDEEEACNETPGMSGTCSWALKEAPRTASSARVMRLDDAYGWRSKTPGV
jgi:hypothetical protein